MMMKALPFLLFAMLGTCWCQTGIVDGWMNLFQSTIGHLQSLLPYGSSGVKTKAIAQSQFGSNTGPGKVVNGVNLLTGQPSYVIPLGGMTVRGVSFPISLVYSGVTKPQAEYDNSQTPTSWVGLGWDLSMPFVATNHKGTYASVDDVLFCNLGPYGGGQILLNAAGTKFQVSSNPYIKVAFDTASTDEYARQFTRWIFTFQDGKKMIFGQDTNAQRYVMYNNGKITASPFNYVTSKKFIYRWDLSLLYDTIPGSTPKNKISFEYERFLESATSTKSYVREAYIRNIKWMEGSQEVERFEFKTTPKGISEYFGYAANESKDDQRLFETRRLDTLKSFREGQLDYFYKFDWTTQAKGLLNQIRIFYPRPRPPFLAPPLSPDIPVQDSGWAFEYEGSSKHYLLKSVITPSSRKDSYTYNSFFLGGSQADQDYTDYIMKRADHVTDVQLPTTTTLLNLWSAENSCDERFCYSVAKDGDNTYNSGSGAAFGTNGMYVEVKRNLGAFFDPRSTDGSNGAVTLRLEVADNGTSPDDFQFIPAGNYVLATNLRTGFIWVYENDGVKWVEKFPFLNDSRYSSSTGFGERIRVIPSANYFLVQKMTIPSQVFVAFRNDSGWTSLNRNDVCSFSNFGSYGESIRNASSTPCLEWASPDLRISANPNYFLILENPHDVFCAYSLRSDGKGFQEISQKFSDGATIQMTGKPMNWDFNVKGVHSTSDYILVYSELAGTHNLSAFYFDGDTIQQAMPHYAGGGAMIAYPSSDYFVLATAGSQNNITFWQKRFQSNGTFDFFQAGTVRTDYSSAIKLLVRPHPTAFSLEYYSNDANIGLRPKIISNQYATYLYQVNRSFSSGFADRTSEITDNGKRLFNLSFSGSDNLLHGAYGNNVSDLCSEDLTTNCNISTLSGRTQPKNTTTFLASPLDVMPMTSKKPYKQSHRVRSNCGRLSNEMVLDSSGIGDGRQGRIWHRHLQYNGNDFRYPSDAFVVDTMASDAALDGLGRNRTKFAYRYNPDSTHLTEFNSNLMLHQFEIGEVAQKSSTNDSLGVTRTFFNLDKFNDPMSGMTMFLNGTEKYTAVLSRGRDTTVRMTAKNTPYRNPSWAGPLYVNRPTASYSMTTQPGRGRMSDTTYYFNFCDTNGSPRYSLNVNRPDKILLTQRVYDSLGFAKQSMSYKLPQFPDTSMLKVWDNENSHADSPVVAAAKAVYKGYYFQEDSIWRETDQSLTDQDLRTGKDPVFSILSGWLPGSKITQRDTGNYFQVLEQRSVKSKAATAVGEVYTSSFYEGLRSDPVATVSNAKLENCAILMGESGNAGLPANKLEHRGRWEVGGNTTFNNARSHTGRYSLKVVDSYGPTVNLALKDVRDLAFGFRVSAWIYSEPAGTPKLAVERRGSTTYVDYGSPVTGNADKKRVWQRWEKRFTHAELVANGFFASGSNDYLRIWVGTGQPTGVASNIVYVDDIVCVPTNAAFQLTTYDRRGPVTSATDAFHRAIFYDLGFKGQVMTARDDKFRAFGQGAAHAMGEN